MQVLKYIASLDPDQRKANFTDQPIRLDQVHYQVSFQTLPNQGLYEATVAVDTVAPSYAVVEVSRTNSYGFDPQCIMMTRPDLRKFCLCRRKLTPPGGG